MDLYWSYIKTTGGNCLNATCSKATFRFGEHLTSPWNSNMIQDRTGMVTDSISKTIPRWQDSRKTNNLKTMCLSNQCILQVCSVRKIRANNGFISYQTGCMKEAVCFVFMWTHTQMYNMLTIHIRSFPISVRSLSCTKSIFLLIWTRLKTNPRDHNLMLKTDHVLIF